MAARLCSLFSGIGGFELGFKRAGFETVMMCESDEDARSVLEKRFPGHPIRRDVQAIKSLPRCEVLTAGWPCQDLSQAGRTAGIGGLRSGLIGEVFRLVRETKQKPDYIVLENVAFALHLQGGRALSFVTSELEALGYSWAYRILDSRHFGLPQRRRRLFIVASRHEVASASILFDGRTDEAEVAGACSMTGFYWTEGNTGLGWSPGAVPPLKGGSGLSIPSPPAIWRADQQLFFTPGISDAERMQGFPVGWTKIPDATKKSERARWRLVGNAVSVPVAEWIARRILKEPVLCATGPGRKKANAGTGTPKSASQYFYLPEAPLVSRLVTLTDFKIRAEKPLSDRAASGFYKRIMGSTLKTNPAFVQDLRRYVS